MNDMEKAIERYEKFIKKFSTCDLLEYFSLMSIESYRMNEKGFTIVDIPYYNKKTGKKEITEFGYGQWELVQICYYAIKYSNDYRGKKVKKLDFYNLINENKIYSEKVENVKDMDSVKLFEHLQCLSNIQFDYQTFGIINKFNRMYQIMVNINKNKMYNQTEEVCYIDFENKFKEITGIEYNKFINIYYIIVILSTKRKNTNIYDIIQDIQFDTSKLGFSKEDIIKVIEVISKDYNFYKRSNNWNLLRFYPIVKTSKGENKYIISNIYSLILSFPDAIYWIIRNYYCKIKSNDFTIYFGKCFEYYLKEVLDYYNIKYEKLKESQEKKMPDWKIETKKYIILVEQKSALFPIDARITDREERYEKIEGYLKNNIVKAFKQLNEFKINNTDKEVIRMCLTFEKIYMEENVKYIINKYMKFDSDENLNWIVNIDEFEILMDILCNNEDDFNAIIEKKIILEKTKDKKGRNIEMLLAGRKYNYTGKQINHFKNIAESIEKKISE